MLVLDDTGQAEFTLIGDIARHIIPSSPQQTVLNNYQGILPVTNLAIAATQISHTPPELAAITSRRYKFLVQVTADRFQGSSTSFHVHSAHPNEGYAFILHHDEQAATFSLGIIILC